VTRRGANLHFGADKLQIDDFFACFKPKIISNSHIEHAGFAAGFCPAFVHPLMSRVDALRPPV
jgi:hypothetical protein